jgi:hypothetical protein
MMRSDVPDRACQSIFDGPSPAKARQHRSGVKVEVSCPLRYCLGSSLVLDRAITALVVCLLESRCPPTVVGLVISVWVDPIQAVFRGGLRSHIHKEVLERRPPSLADANSAATVVLKRILARIVAAVSHAGPGFEFGGFGRAMSREALFPLTTTTYRFPNHQLAPGNRLFCSAGTPAEPYSGACAASPDPIEHGEATELLAGHINQTVARVRVIAPGRTGARGCRILHRCGASNAVDTARLLPAARANLLLYSSPSGVQVPIGERL